MEIFLTVLKYIGGPLIGALIGYFTNWLAVKMLFRPYYPKKIGKLKLPFTPGIIPKRRNALAKAVGEAVGGKLFTGDDLISALSEGGAEQKFSDYAVSLWQGLGEKSLNELLATFLPPEKTQSFKQETDGFLTEKIYGAVQKTDIGEIVANEGAKAIRLKKTSLGMLAMFISDELIDSLAEKLAEGVNGYVAENGRQIIAGAVNAETQSAASSPLCAVTEKISEQTVRGAAVALYNGAVKHAVAELAANVDIAAVVEEKINAMDIKDLEKLVLSVMKKELNAIVNLGALIGFILGIIMIFI